MKTFNLEQALNGVEIQTVSGLPARLICSDRLDSKSNGSGYPLVVLVMSCKDNEVVKYYTKDGKIDANDRSKFDLVMKPFKEKFFQNVYRDRVTNLIKTPQDLFESLAEAKNKIVNSDTKEYLTTVEFVIEV